MQILKNFAKAILSRNWLLPLAKGRRYVILFHDVSEPGEPQHNTDVSIGVWPYSYKTADFIGLIELLGRLFELVSLDEIVSEKPTGEKKNFATIAFDDGFLSVRATALPILKVRGIPFSVFINKNAVLHNRLPASTKVMIRKAVIRGNEELLHKLYSRYCSESAPPYDAFMKNPLQYISEKQIASDDAFLCSLPCMNEKIYLDEEDVRCLFRNGVTIGSHTVSHRMLASCDEATLKFEIFENKTYLTNLLRSEIHHFAIPFGGKDTFTDLALDTCRQAGHKYIYSTSPTSFCYRDITLSQGLIPRYCIYKPNPREFLFYINRPFFLTSKQ